MLVDALSNTDGELGGLLHGGVPVLVRCLELLDERGVDAVEVRDLEVLEDEGGLRASSGELDEDGELLLLSTSPGLA